MRSFLRLFAFKNCGPRGPGCSPCASVLSPRSPDTPGLKDPSFGNRRFCAFTVPTHSEPIRGNPSLRAEDPNRNTPLNGQVQHACKIGVAPTCTKLHQLAPTCGKKYFWAKRNSASHANSGRRGNPSQPKLTEAFTQNLNPAHTLTERNPYILPVRVSRS